MIKHAMIVGYGIMGRGISLSFFRGGHNVTVLSRDPEGIRKTPEGIKIVSKFPNDPPDLIIEAVPEDLNLKTSLLAAWKRLTLEYQL